MLTDQEMLSAVNARNAEFDGVFVYAVKTTGIFCRPSCGSRPAKPENMSFYETAQHADQNGFRPCLKCKPYQFVDANDKTAMAKRVCRILEEHMASYDGTKPTLKMLSKLIGFSEDYLSKSFRKVMGIGPLDYFDALRNKVLKQSLKGNGSVADATYTAGFGSSSRVYEAAKERLGMSPASYAKGGKGAEIAYAIVGCFLGRMLVGGTQNGVCAVYFGDRDAALIEELKMEFPQADIGAEIGELSYWAQTIINFLEQGDKVTLDVPLDMYGTAFQRLVWQELLKIAPGEIKTYKQIACDMGREKSSRAVGRACATNPVSLVVPCHRVIGSDGKLHGYRWGLNRKAALTEWEQKFAPALKSAI